MRGQYVNRGIDFAISLNKMPVCFKDNDNVTINLVDGCILLVWLNYISSLKGHPMAEANSCQLILKYMLINRDAFVKSYHDRMYFYSSGTKFCEVSVKLAEWQIKQDKLHAAYKLKEHEEGYSADDVPPTAKQALKRLLDVNGLYGILGDACIQFMKKKPQPYGVKATMYRDVFWEVPIFKRALFFVFFLRYTLGYKSQRNWRKFLQSDYKFNTRTFKRWEDNETDIFHENALYAKMPEKQTVNVMPRKKKLVGDSDPFSSDSPMKRRFVVQDDSTDSE